MRVVKSSNDFFDILDGLKGGAIVTIGYVTEAVLNIPKVKRKNPLTNRMKGYYDYSMFHKDGENEPGALVKITSYNFNYRNRKSIHDEYYNRIKPATNAIRNEFGLADTGTRSGYKNVMNYGDSGQEVYKGGNEKLFGNSYSPQNMFKPLKVKSTVYVVDKEGNVIRGLNEDEVIPYLQKKEVNGVPELRKMGMEEERIQEYIRKIMELKFSYRNFEANSILYIVATVNGEKLIYINDNLKRCVQDININPSDFIKIAREKYKKDIQEENERLKKGNVKRLTESQLERIVEMSVRNIIRNMLK